MQLALDNEGALYEQIARALKRAIVEGQIRAGSRLPSTRAMARALQVSRRPIIQAYDLLCTEQIAVARMGSGTRAAEISAPPPPRVSQLRRPTSGYVARMRKLGEITTRARPNLQYNLQYGEPLLNTSMFGSWRRNSPPRQCEPEANARRKGVSCRYVARWLTT